MGEGLGGSGQTPRPAPQPASTKGEGGVLTQGICPYPYGDVVNWQASDIVPDLTTKEGVLEMVIGLRHLVMGTLVGFALCLTTTATGCSGDESAISKDQPPDPTVTEGDPAAVGGAKTPEP